MTRVVKTQVEQEGRIVEEKVVVDGPELEPWPPDAALEVVGRPVSRVDAVERVTGRAVYTHDAHPQGMLYGKVLRCPFAHARIKRVDASRALLLPGVRAVLTHQNAPPIPVDRRSSTARYRRPLPRLRGGGSGSGRPASGRRPP